MPPKKRQRLANNTKTDAVAALSMQDLSPLQVRLKDWICQVYSLRHGSAEKHPWPVESGGSLLALCQRAWGDKESMLKFSLSLVQKMGFMAESAGISDFEAKYLAPQDRVAQSQRQWFGLDISPI